MSIVQKLRFAKKFVAHPAAPKELTDRLEAKAASPEQQRHRWTDGDSISEAHNAHYTNTPEELSQALSGDYNFLEGDIWLEGAARNLPVLDRFREPIMAHDHTDVDGLTLKEWLGVGKASGKGLKLDIKQSAAIPKVIEAVKNSGIPGKRFIFNADMVHGPGWVNDTRFKLGNALMNIQTQVDEMRQFRSAFPKSTLAVGLYTAATPSGTGYSKGQLEQAIDIAGQLGGPITFPLRAEFVTPETVEKLKPHGTVSIWNDPKSHAPDDLAKEKQRFLDMGVDGMIDLRN